MVQKARMRIRDKRLASLHRRANRWNEDDEEDDPKDHAAMARSMAAFRHKLFTLLYFWTVCPRACCKRARACVGDASLCGTRHLPFVPAHFKAWLHKVMQARAAGLSNAEACRTVDEEMRRHDEEMRRHDEASAQWEAQAASAEHTL